ncbi:MAG: spore cortex-lytic enzyme [Clostridia bacterium]|nr:spore cortex-lytic enzyme [Clostridia bacterium]
MNNCKIRISRRVIKKLWQVFIILLLILLLSEIIEYTSVIYSHTNRDNINNSAQSVLSQTGSRGNEVRQIQSKLKQLGHYKGSIDGIFGSDTKKAVISFQKSCGLKADGVAGPKTLLYLGLGSGSSSGYSSNDVYLLAKVIEAEARGESYTGQVAVGAVILNRVDHSSFPDSISGVVYQSGAFDCVYDSNWGVEPSSTSRKAANDAINGWDPTGGAIYYYNPAKTSNKWIRSRPVVTVIGRHYFCT